MTDITTVITLMLLCLFNICFGFAWRGYYYHINPQNNGDLESHESPILSRSSYHFWRRKKVPETRHLPLLRNNQHIKHAQNQNRYLYSDYTRKQKDSNSLLKKIAKVQKQFDESNSLEDLNYVPDSEILNSLFANNIPNTIPQVIFPNERSYKHENHFLNTFSVNPGMSEKLEEKPNEDVSYFNSLTAESENRLRQENRNNVENLLKLSPTSQSDNYNSFSEYSSDQASDKPAENGFQTFGNIDGKYDNFDIFFTDNNQNGDGNLFPFADKMQENIFETEGPVKGNMFPVMEQKGFSESSHFPNLQDKFDHFDALEINPQDNFDNFDALETNSQNDNFDSFDALETKQNNFDNFDALETISHDDFDRFDALETSSNDDFNGFEGGFSSDFEGEFSSDFETEPLSIPGGTFHSKIPEGEFETDAIHCEDITTRHCITNQDCLCYGSYHCDKTQHRCVLNRSTVPKIYQNEPESTGFEEWHR